MQIMQPRRHDVVGGIEQMNAAILELGDLVGIEDVIPGVDRCVGAENLLHLLHVVADAGGAPHVIDGVEIAGIGSGKLLGDFRPGNAAFGSFDLSSFWKMPALI